MIFCFLCILVHCAHGFTSDEDERGAGFLSSLLDELSGFQCPFVAP
jgi:hypothetical protein